MTTDNLIYLLADLFNTNIHKIDGQYRGHMEKSFDLGGVWTLKTNIVICVDENNPKLLTAFVRIRKNLWAYAIVNDTGKWLLFFDNDRVKIKVGAEREFGIGNGMGTITRLKTAITGAVTFLDGKWTTTDPQALIQGM